MQIRYYNIRREVASLLFLFRKRIVMDILSVANTLSTDGKSELTKKRLNLRSKFHSHPSSAPRSYNQKMDADF